MGGGVIYTVRVTTPLNCSATNKLTLTENINVPVLTLSQLAPNTVCDVTKATNPYNGSIIGSVTFGKDGLGNPISVPLPNANYSFSWYSQTTTTSGVPIISPEPTLTGLQ